MLTTAGAQHNPKPAIVTTAIIDDLPVGARQIIILLLTFAITLADGADMQMLAFAAPAVIADWDVSKLAFTPALSAALFGMIVGVVAGGYLGDRFGRKRALLWSVVLMGGATVATGFATDLSEMTVLRFIGGIGFGGVTPTAYALGVEVMPHRSRTWISAVASLVNALGGLLGSAIALVVIPVHGWQGAFYVSGGLSLALGLLILWFTPESPSFLFARGKVARARAAFRHILGPDRVPEDVMPAAEPGVDGQVQAAPSLLSRAFARTTIGAWMVYFGTAFATYASVNWLPTIMTNNHWSFATSVRVAGVMNLASATGLCLFMVGAARLGTRAFMLSAVVAIVAFAAAMPFLVAEGGQAQPPAMAIMVTAALLGYGGGSLMGANLAVVGAAYPAVIRSRGVGYALSFARIGSATATVAMGGLLYYTWDNLFAFFGAVIGAAVLVAAGALIINRHIPGRRRAAS